MINSYRKTEKRNSDIFPSTHHIINHLLICFQQFYHLQSSDMIKRQKRRKLGEEKCDETMKTVAGLLRNHFDNY